MIAYDHSLRSHDLAATRRDDFAVGINDGAAGAMLSMRAEPASLQRRSREVISSLSSIAAES